MRRGAVLILTVLMLLKNLPGLIRIGRGTETKVDVLGKIFGKKTKK